jgi:hemerythrin superfamily protein
MTVTEQQDVVDFLLHQHTQIKALFSRVASEPPGKQKRELFEDLVRLLAVHETAEEEVVHPTARRTIDAGEQVVEGRRREEDQAKRELAALYDMGVDHPEFNAKLAKLSEAVRQHANREESEEFQSLRRKMSKEQLIRMAGAVRAAEQLAPTRPHPRSGESAPANLLTGPPMAIFDRVRDRIRDWREAQADR